MIREMNGLPDNVVGFIGTGRVTAADYEDVLIPVVEKRFRTQRHLRCLCVLDSGFEGFDAAAMWEDTKIGLRHYAGWERVAIVTDSSAIRLAARAFGVLSPCPLRAYALKDEARARSWIEE